MWRVMTGLHKKIEYCFLLVGHTKFSPDGCFGLIKRLFRRTKVSCLQDFADVVSKSGEVNHPQLTGTQSGQVVVPTYDWTSFFAPRFRPLAGIKRLHHIVISETNLPNITVREYSDSPEREVCIVRDVHWRPHSDDLPQIIPPAGLDSKRQWYLYNEIREYCTDETKDLVCPLPSIDCVQEESMDEAEEEHEDEDPIPAPTTRRCCRLCHQRGHNSRTCPLR